MTAKPRKRSGRRRLTAGQPRVFERHNTAEARVFRATWLALCAEFGQPPPISLIREEMSRAARLAVALRGAERALDEARATFGPRRRPRGLSEVDAIRRQVEHGKGRLEIARREKRIGLLTVDWERALDRLRELAGASRPLTLPQQIQAAQEARR